MWLLRRNRWDRRNKVLEMPASGVYGTPIVRELFYDSNLAAICGGRTADGHYREVSALLHFEQGNPHDLSAVRVEIEGRTVGHLSYRDAKAYRRVLDARGRSGVTVRCAALITGGHTGSDGKAGSNFEVRLDLGR